MVFHCSKGEHPNLKCGVEPGYHSSPFSGLAVAPVSLALYTPLPPLLSGVAKGLMYGDRNVSTHFKNQSVIYYLFLLPGQWQ